MRRRFLLLSLLVIALGCHLAWRCYTISKMSPGVSVFADYLPQSLGKTWTITGSPGSDKLAFVGPTGGIQPRINSYSVHFFVYDRDQRRLYSPLLHNTHAQSMFLNEHCPNLVWNADGIDCAELAFASADACYSECSFVNRSHRTRHISVYVAAVPFTVIGPMQSGYRIMCDINSGSIVVDGKVLLTSAARPTGAGAISADDGNDITGYIRNGLLPTASEANGDGPSGALRFDATLKPKGEIGLQLKMPMVDVKPGRMEHVRPRLVRQASSDVSKAWDQRLGRVRLEVPDQRVMSCWNASLSYLLMLSGGGKPVPGPSKYHSFWVRDAAYIADALYYTGQHESIPPTLKQIRSMQLPSGAFLCKTGDSASELDAQGEAIYALVQHYRRTGDLATLRDAWPGILASCRYIKSKRLIGSGVLPASVSAEDLGDGDQQHYWDDFWCVRGLRDAAFVAGKLGKKSDAAWLDAEADSLLSAVVESARKVMAKRSIAYIPNGPQDWLSSAMARGTSCALWPCFVLDVSDTLTKKSFDFYWDKWIAPSKGGFVHKDHYWPYAGMDLALGYLMLGQRERAWTMLDWTLDHDPTHGFFSWPEGMSRKDLSLAEGDMPHGWMCASYISLVRNMLVRESGRDLVLLSGVPKQWLKSGARMGVTDLSTEFGKVSFYAKVSQSALKLTFVGVKPKATCRVVLPANRVVVVPAGAHEVTIPL